jgi:hypothetical protein
VQTAAVAAAHEQTLVELAQWLARVQQYSPTHPACAPFGERTHRALLRSLSFESAIAFGVQKDGMTFGDGEVSHPAVRTRLAPHLYERGVLALRFVTGVTYAELASLVELLALPVQTTFDRGGINRLVLDRGLTRIQIQEYAHDISQEERDAQRARTRLRTLFSEALRDLLAKRSLEGLTGEALLELLEHADIAITILEEDPLGVAEAFAGLALMVRDEERRTGKALYSKLKRILLALAPPSHDRVLLGLPSMVADFREALVWSLDGLHEGELARIVLASIRSHALELDVVFYALSVAVPHNGRRYSTVRFVGLGLHDLPVDDAAATALINTCAHRASDFDSYRTERDLLTPHAVRVLAGRALVPVQAGSVVPPAMEEAPLAFEARRPMIDLVRMAARTRRFGELCKKLPASAETLTRAGSTEAVIGILRGLLAVTRPEARELAQRTVREVLTPSVAEQLLADLDATSTTLEGALLEDLAATVRFIGSLRPDEVFERLEQSESRKMRRLLVDCLSNTGPTLLPRVRSRLASPNWYVVRNALVLLPRVGGTPRDVLAVARHPQEKIRLEVVRALRAMQPDAVTMEIVASYLSDPIVDIRRHASVMLRGDLLNAGSIVILERVALDEQQPEEIRQRVIAALGQSSDDAAATALFTLLQPRGLLDLSSLRDTVALALRRSPARLAAGYFAEGLRSPAWRVRKACERAAGSGT